MKGSLGGAVAGNGRSRPSRPRRRVNSAGLGPMLGRIPTPPGPSQAVTDGEWYQMCTICAPTLPKSANRTRTCTIEPDRPTDYSQRGRAEEHARRYSRKLRNPAGCPAELGHQRIGGEGTIPHRAGSIWAPPNWRGENTHGWDGAHLLCPALPPPLRT